MQSPAQGILQHGNRRCDNCHQPCAYFQRACTRCHHRLEHPTLASTPRSHSGHRPANDVPPEALSQIARGNPQTASDYAATLRTFNQESRRAYARDMVRQAEEATSRGTVVENRYRQTPTRRPLTPIPQQDPTMRLGAGQLPMHSEQPRVPLPPTTAAEAVVHNKAA